MVAPRHALSPAEYLAWERTQPTKHEFLRGEVFAMAGGSPRHNALCVNVSSLLRERSRSCGCYVFTSEQRIRANDGDRYVYPDVSVVCGKPIVESHDVITNPTVIVEVLSRAAEQNDRGSKWQSYQQLDSLTDYLLVAQGERRIEQFLRDPQGGWTYRSAGAGERLVLGSGVELGVDEVFDNVMELPGDGEPPT